MPIYDYVCGACGHRFEAFHGLNEVGPHQCPVCASGPVKRAFAPPTIVFKGTGWAKLDRRHAASPRRRKEGETAPSTGGADSAGSSATVEKSAGASDGPAKSDAPNASRTSSGDPPAASGSPAESSGG